MNNCPMVGWNQVWERLPIGSSGGTPDTKNKDYYDGNIAWVVTGDLTDSYVNTSYKTITKAGLDNSSAKIVPIGSVLIAMYGASIGRLGIANIDCATNQAIAYTKTIYGDISNWFLFYYLQAKKEEIVSLGVGGAQPNISQTILRQIPIPLPPLAEQARIVAALDGLMARVRSAQEQLATVPKLLKRFRQSVLSAAVSGQLTEDWRVENPDVEDDPVLSYLKDLDVYDSEGIKFPIPDSWTVARSNSIFEFVTSGSRGWAQYYSDEGAIFIRITNLDYNTLQIDLSENKLQHVSPPKNAEGTRTRVRKNDVLISITGEVGMIGIVKEGIGEAYINQHIALARPIQGIEVNYLGISLSAQNGGIAQVKEMAKGATKAGLTLSDIRNLAIPIPPLIEQKEIVKRVNDLLVLANRLQKGYEVTKAQLDMMPAGILAKAFAGELTEQDPTDEPAQVLLERIWAERLRQQQEPKIKKAIIEKTGRKQRKKMTEKLQPIKAILATANAPVSTHSVWRQSVHKDDIEAFYADLKQLVDVEGSVEDVKEGDQSFLKLTHAD